MPELPEVEVVRLALNQNLKGRKIDKIECFYAPILIDLDNFLKRVSQQRIVRVDRYAKYLIFILEQGCFISHLRMEGKYFYVDKDYEIKKHQHVIFYLDNGYRLIYQDVRKFGRMLFKDLEDLYQTPPLSLLGPEANQTNQPIKELYTKMKKSSQPIKSLLLDQSFISGLGNIYVDEVLFAASISPKRKASNLTLKELEIILKESKRILDQAILCKGTTIRSYTSSLGVEGEYQKELLAHLQKVCPKCQGTLAIIKIGGRSSYYCQKCQR